MEIKKTCIALATCSFLLFSTYSYAEIFYNSDSDGPTGWADDDNTPSYSRTSYNNDDDSSVPVTHTQSHKKGHKSRGSYASRLPSHIQTNGERVILVNPNVHAWGAYSRDGKLTRAGLATAGSSWCPDIDRPCRTRAGTFHIQSLGGSDCKSTRYPVGEGGAHMPYCMYFNGSQGIHGSNELAEANLSHGCVRISVSDARWLRFNFSEIGTKVVIKPY